MNNHSEEHIFTGTVAPHTRNATAVKVSYTCDYAGEYQLYIEEVWREAPDDTVRANQRAQIQGSPFKLTVTDNQGATNSDNAVVTVSDVGTNIFPIADAGAAKIVKLVIDDASLVKAAAFATPHWPGLSEPS